MLGVPLFLIGVPIAVVLAIALLNWWLGYLESRGAFPEISSLGGPRSMGHALLSAQAIVEPQKRHVIAMKERDAIRKDVAESGAPPRP